MDKEVTYAATRAPGPLRALRQRGELLRDNHVPWQQPDFELNLQHFPLARLRCYAKTDSAAHGYRNR